MGFLRLYEIIFEVILLLFAIYHIYKRQFKLLKSIVLIVILSFLSAFLNLIFKIKIDMFSNLLYFIFLFMSLYLGGTIHFYDKYRWWDQSIHFLSGVSFVGFGIGIAGTNFGIKKWSILLFSFTFSITLHAFWEVLEYISDCISHGNAQRWQKIHASTNHVSEKAIQPAGLVDTMNDIICCMIGSLLSVIVWWFML